MARSKGSDTPLLKKGRWQSHYVNGLPFTIALATFALVAVGGVIMLSAMLVSGSAKEAQELLPAAPPSLHSNVYGAKHEGGKWRWKRGRWALRSLWKVWDLRITWLEMLSLASGRRRWESLDLRR
uniref:Uncharacterized protein n=2 Tax=Guillardia theta TaxID=55529 RepID=A0A7S4KEW5_GUITH